MSRLAVVDVPVSEPFPWHELLNYFSPRLIPHFERIEGGRFHRRFDDRWIVVAYDRPRSRLIVSADGCVSTAEVTARVSRLFAVGHQGDAAAAHLRQDPLLHASISAVPGMRPLGAWSAFELCVRTVVGQQVTVAAAGTLMRRLVERCGDVTPSAVLAADLTGLGMPGKRVETIRHLARALRERRLHFARPWPAIDAQLKTLPGFGPWTRAYLAIRLGREPDAFPESDLGLIRACGASSPAALLQRAERWRPWRAYAATYLWAVTPSTNSAATL